MDTKTFSFSNGDTVKNKLNGYTGVITGTVFFLSGCTHYCVASMKDNEDGITIEEHWMESETLESFDVPELTKNEILKRASYCNIIR